MKKIGILTLGVTLIVSGCSFNNTSTEVDTGDYIAEVVKDIPEITYSGAMQKPSIEEMENFDAITDGYVKDWDMDYTVTKDDLKYIDSGCSKIEINGGGQHTHYSNSFKKSEVEAGNTVKLKGKYKFDDSKLKLTNDEKKTLSTRGWDIVPADRYENLWKLNYSKDSAELDAYRGEEEWSSLYSKIGGNPDEYERYSANTILITNDLLLHSFHKLFDNTLKYYEQTVARDNIKELSNNLYERFINLAKDESDSYIKDTYEFLAAYRAIPSIILGDGGSSYNGGFGMFGRMGGSNGGSDNESVKNTIRNSINKYVEGLSGLNSKYASIIPKTIEDILDATALEHDSFLAKYSPNYILENNIMQDYTQFVPRSHYTDNDDLKSYFMAMKWLMREKFYFGDDKLTNAALIMVNNISDEDTQKLSELSAKIKKLVGGDDDLTLETLSDWMKENNINSSKSIKNLSKEKRIELSNLVPQKIQSTAFKNPLGEERGADEMKGTSNGFVFFGEKFTLDSYMFDLMTAPETEIEFKIMPNKQTALIVPDVLENNSDAAHIVDLWMKEEIKKGNVIENKTYKQYSSYNKVKQDTQDMIEHEIETTTVMESVYHKRLKMLGNLINETEENAPYFKFDGLYKLKNLLTYMGSYTELKHDTLLYVKQAYAMDSNYAGGFGREINCNFKVDPPSLPVPKGYIESDIDIIDNIIELNNEVKLDFGELGERIESKFTGFNEFLKHTKTILEQQMDNKVISDEDFEWMRTAYDELGYIVYPFGKEVSKKEMRAALIADIFTSENNGDVDPLYEALGRPALMLVMINDINGKRVAIGPVYTHYEFYDSDKVVDAKGSRLNDLQWQAAYDGLSGNKLDSALSTLSRELYNGLK